MEKLFISNRNNLKIAVVIEQCPLQKGIVFVMHGLGGFKEQLEIRAIAEAFYSKNYTVITFDARNSVGESEGLMEEALMTNYYEDLEDVISWAQGQSWYQEPFVLSGCSLGGLCTTLFAENHPEKVSFLVPISTVVSGKLSIENKPKEVIEDWKERGWQDRPSVSKPGVIKRIKWAYVEDGMKYDLLPKVSNLRMPVLQIVGEADTSTPLKHQQILFEQLPGRKELHTVEGAPHTFREEEHLEAVKQIIEKWIDLL